MKTSDNCPTCGVHKLIGDICSGCGLPKDICSCAALEKETSQKIKVTITKAKFRKFVTIIVGVEKNAIDRVGKELKQTLACGGSVKDEKIILQGDHRVKIKKMLVALGYPEENITLSMMDGGGGGGGRGRRR
jgi:translation initiation factor 1